MLLPSLTVRSHAVPPTLIRPCHMNAAMTLVAAFILCSVPSSADSAPPDAALVSDLIKDLDGSLVRAQRNGIIVTDKEGTEYTVLYPDSLISMIVQGEAIPAFLRQGLFVRTRVNFNQLGKPMSAVETLEVISPVPANAVKGHEINRYKPGVNPVNRETKTGMPGEYYVVGQLRNMGGGYIAVQAGQVPLQLPVNPECKLVIRSHDLSIAMAGDRVVVKGFYDEAKPELIKADTIRILPTRIFGEPVEKPSRKRKKKRTDNDKTPEETKESNESESPEAEMKPAEAE